MANKIKLTRPNKSKSSPHYVSGASEMHDYLFKLCTQIEKAFNDILKKTGDSDNEILKLAEEVEALGENMEELEERIELLEGAI